MSSISARDSDFFFVQRSCHVYQFTYSFMMMYLSRAFSIIFTIQCCLVLHLQKGAINPLQQVAIDYSAASIRITLTFNTIISAIFTAYMYQNSQKPCFPCNSLQRPHLYKKGSSLLLRIRLVCRSSAEDSFLLQHWQASLFLRCPTVTMRNNSLKQKKATTTRSNAFSI